MNITSFVVLAMIIGLVWTGLYYGSKISVRVNTDGVLTVALRVGGLLSVVFFATGEVRGLIRGWAFFGGLACGFDVSARAGRMYGTLVGLGMAFGAYALTGLM